MTLSVSEEDTCYYINSNTFILWVSNIKKYFKVDLILRFMLSTMLHGVIKVILICKVPVSNYNNNEERPNYSQLLSAW